MTETDKTLATNQMLRRTGITAKEAVALAGLGGYATLTEIYEAKVLDKPLPLDPPPKLSMLQAHYRMATRFRIETHPLMRHPERRFALADPGCAAVGALTTLPTRSDEQLDAAGLGLAEKLVRFVSSQRSKQWGPAGGQIVPPRIYNEAQWDMGVLQKAETDVAVSFVGGGFAIYTLKYVEEIFSGYYSIAEHFMSTFCLPEIPPPTMKEMKDALEKLRRDNAAAKKAAKDKPA